MKHFLVEMRRHTEGATESLVLMISESNFLFYSPTDLSDSTLSYTETEAASSPNITPGEFSGGCVFTTVVSLQIWRLYPKCLILILQMNDYQKFIISEEPHYKY